MLYMTDYSKHYTKIRKEIKKAIHSHRAYTIKCMNM